MWPCTPEPILFWYLSPSPTFTLFNKYRVLLEAVKPHADVAAAGRVETEACGNKKLWTLGKNIDLRSELGLQLHLTIIITVMFAMQAWACVLAWRGAVLCLLASLLYSVFGSVRCNVSTSAGPRLSLQPGDLMGPDSLFTLDAISLTFLHGLALTSSWWRTALLN